MVVMATICSLPTQLLLLMILLDRLLLLFTICQVGQVTTA
jgi:hypothetical protein